MDKKNFLGLIFFCAVLMAGASYGPLLKETFVFKPIEELKVRISSTMQIPDPVSIQSSGDWFYLDHISSGLARYNSDSKKFSHFLASYWSAQPDGTHVFILEPGAKFHDGTPITVKDVLWSLKRQLILKTSTHFPLWDYVVGCERLKTLDDPCDGLYQKSDHEIVFRLTAQAQSFYLQLASPETGIWWSGDLKVDDPKYFAPTKFSGAYFVAEVSPESVLLKKNPYSPLNALFPDSPKSIRMNRVPLSSLNTKLLKGELDLAVRTYNPFNEPDWKSAGLDVMSTSASSIIYLFGLGKGSRPAIGRDFIQALWRHNSDKVLTPADTFLPFGKDYILSRQEFLAQLPEKTATHLRILCPDGFFAPPFLEQMRTAAAEVGTTLEFSFAGQTDFLATFNDPKATEKFDYIMSLYVASERYPAVQLRYMTKKLLDPPIDLKKAEVPDLNGERERILKDYQKWLLQARQAIPVFFDVTLYVHKKNIDIGNQSTTDAEIELWRVRERGL